MKLNRVWEKAGRLLIPRYEFDGGSDTGIMCSVASAPAYSYWRLNITANNGDTYTQIQYMELHEFIGGPNVAGSATITVSDFVASNPGTNVLVDDSTSWLVTGGTCSITFQFASGTSILEFIVKCWTSPRAPKTFTLQKSTDGVSFINAISPANQTGWSNFSARTFS